MPSRQRVVDVGPIKGGGYGAKRFQHGENIFNDWGSGVNDCLVSTGSGVSAMRHHLLLSLC